MTEIDQWMFELFKDKLRDMKIYGVYLSKHQFKSDSAKLKVLKSTLLTDAEGQDFMEKMWK